MQRRPWTLCGLALCTAAALVLPASAAQAATNTADTADISIQAGYLRLGLDQTGTVTQLTDSRTGTNYLASGKQAPLVSLVIDGQQERPTKVVQTGDGTLIFSNPKADFQIKVAVRDRATYSTFTVTSVKANPHADVQTLLWGPLATSITQTIGETVGVVRNDDFAIGLKPLTDRTEGAWPQEYQNYGWENQVEPNPSHLALDTLEKWSAAGETSWGTVLRAFTFDYTKARDRMNPEGGTVRVGPLPGDQGQITGSAIALYGAAPAMVPTVLSQVAKEQNLPYPTIDGQWQKAAQATSQSFLVLSDLTSQNIPQAATFARQAGINYIYSLPPNAVGPWQTTGHYQFDASLGGSDAGAAAAARLAATDGVHLGVHTISDFISDDDAYVRQGGPDLATATSARLTRPLAAGDTTAYVDSATLTQSGIAGTMLRIGDEYIGYSSASQDGSDWVITGLTRGQWGSTPADHPAGSTASRLILNSYGGAIGGLSIIDQIATRLASAWNDTGIKAMSFDGLESASQSGWGSYGQARLVNDTYRQMASTDGFISETSRMTSNTWDGLSRASWGEVGTTTMGQVFTNNAYYQDNYLPGMLGWISFDSGQTLMQVEDNLARGAGLNAGAGLQTSVADLAAGGAHTDQLLDAVKQWETARNLGAFTPAQKAAFRDQSTHWHLSVVRPDAEWSLQQLAASGQPIGAPQDVRVPTPALVTSSLPAGGIGSLYESKVQTNTPATTRFEVTGGALPAGLSLNADTGGISGVPSQSGSFTFTVTAHNGSLPEASGTYTMTIGPRSAE